MNQSHYFIYRPRTANNSNSNNDIHKKEGAFHCYTTIHWPRKFDDDTVVFETASLVCLLFILFGTIRRHISAFEKRHSCSLSACLLNYVIRIVSPVIIRGIY